MNNLGQASSFTRTNICNIGEICLGGKDKRSSVQLGGSRERGRQGRGTFFDWK